MLRSDFQFLAFQSISCVVNHANWICPTSCHKRKLVMKSSRRGSPSKSYSQPDRVRSCFRLMLVTVFFCLAHLISRLASIAHIVGSVFGHIAAVFFDSLVEGGLLWTPFFHRI
mmetsp:Transcript_61502/g.165249  ORF Transcript_61502/g.165249 Transcript_61502/m.165249 type:complete len:113 (+) Transcript_61502:1395-1733(+)